MGDPKTLQLHIICILHIIHYTILEFSHEIVWFVWQAYSNTAVFSFALFNFSFEIGFV